MITPVIMGGLGNQLFQIYTTIAYAIEHNTQFRFPNQKPDTESHGFPRPMYWDTYLKNLRPYLTGVYPNKMYKEPQYDYTKLPEFDGDVVLYGYFQSYKYFDRYKHFITGMIGIPPQINFNKTVVGCHFRIGDYQYIDKHLVLDKWYYRNAIDYLRSRVQNFAIVVVCCQSDFTQVMKMVSELVDEFKIPFKHLGFKPDHEELQMMTCFDHHIIANSTFSWWGAYLGKGGIVTYPSTWFNKDQPKDLFPDEWVCIKKRIKLYPNPHPWVFGDNKAVYDLTSDQYEFTESDIHDYSAVLGEWMPDVKTSKENTKIFALEPAPFINKPDGFDEWAAKHGTYVTGNTGTLYLPLNVPKRSDPKKKGLMSLMISDKVALPGHQYRHLLAKLILQSNLDIHIYGRGCKLYDPDPRLKGEFTDELYDYRFTIAIENIVEDYYYSEKLTNCAVTYTKPIYLGARNHPYCVVTLTGDLQKDWNTIQTVYAKPDAYDELGDNREVYENKANLLLTFN